MKDARPRTADAAPRSSRFDQRFAERRQHPRERDRLAALWPRLAIHFDPELARRRERHPRKLHLEIFVPGIILDRNSEVRFHKSMLTKATVKTTVHAAVHTPRPIVS